MSDLVTLTLPFTEQGGKVLAIAVTIGFFSGLIWLMLGAVQDEDRGSDPNSRLLVALGWTVFPIWLVLLAGTLFALWQRMNGLSSTGSGSGDTLGMGAVMVALLGAPFLVWSTILKHQTVRFTKEGHMTDRINKAVEQLGAEKTVKSVGKDGSSVEETKPNIEVRIGAILSLERIAQDSTSHDKGRDHVRVMEILCAYLRENAPASSAKKTTRQLWKEEKEAWDGNPDEFEEYFCAEQKIHQPALSDLITVEHARREISKFPAPRADIAMTMQVIGRRDKRQRQVEARWGKDAAPDAEWVFDTPCPRLPDLDDGEALPMGALEDFRKRLQEWEKQISFFKGYKLDLRETNLQRADLSDLCLSGAKIEKVAMEGANLMKVRMKGVRLRNVRMDAAFFESAGLEGVELSSASVESAKFGYARMTGATLWQTSMERAKFYSSEMVGANVSPRQMPNASFWNARLQGAHFCGQASGVSFQGARIEGISLRNADLSKATNLTKTQLATAFGDASITLPGGKGPDSPDWPAHWPKRELDSVDYNAELAKWRASPSTYTPPPP